MISYASCWFPHGDVLTGANFFPGESDVVVVGCCLVWMEGNILEDRVGLREAIESAKCDACAMQPLDCLLYTSPSPRDRTRSRMPSSA